MSDLAAFLAARLDEIESNARQALAQWADTHFTIDPGSLVIVGFHRTHDPARVLREVAAKRAILAAYRAASEDFTHIDENAYEYARRVALEEACEHLAAIYSDHPDYQQE